jgi:hypothetical protein
MLVRRASNAYYDPGTWKLSDAKENQYMPRKQSRTVVPLVFASFSAGWREDARLPDNHVR